MRDDGQLAVTVRADPMNADMVRHRYPMRSAKPTR